MGTSLNTLMIAGAILALLGVAGLAIPEFTTERTSDVAKIGDLKIEAQENTPHSVPPLLAGGALVLGIVLIGGGFVRRG